MATAAAARPSDPAHDFPTVSPWRMLLVCGTALLLGAGVVLGYEVWRFEEFTGHLQAGSNIVVAGRDATLETLLVAAGDQVETGHPLATLSDLRLQRRLREQRHDVEERERELARLEAERDRRIEQEQLEIDDRIFDARMREAQLQRRNREANGDPFANHRWPTLAWPETQAPWWNPEPTPLRIDISNRQQIRLMLNEVPVPATPRLKPPEAEECPPTNRFCQERIAELEERRRQLPEKLSRVMRIDAEASRLEFAKQELAALEAEQAALTVRASVPGTVGMFLKQPGEIAAAHDALVQLFDEERPYVLMRIPSGRVADFAPGVNLELVFPGGRVGGGQVADIPPQTTLEHETGGPRGTTYVDVHVVPRGALWPELPFGSQILVRKSRF